MTAQGQTEVNEVATILQHVVDTLYRST
jgi:hypothetical protein